MSGSEHARPVWLTEDDGIALGYILRGSPGNADLAKWAESMLARRDAAPEDAWSEIAQEFKSHRCKDGNCFAETVMMRLGAIPAGNPSSPFGF